jgi:hypothetical protein
VKHPSLSHTYKYLLPTNIAGQNITNFASCLCVQADILGYSWRAAYFIGGAPGIAVAVLLFFIQVYTVFFVWLGHHNILLCNVNKFTSIFSYSGSEKTG